jgi:hypothetical protein
MGCPHAHKIQRRSPIRDMQRLQLDNIILPPEGLGPALCAARASFYGAHNPVRL